MKRVLVAAMMIAGCGPEDSEPDFPVLSGVFLGQTPPGLEPIPFAPGLLSTPDQVEINSIFSLDGSEFYYVTRDRDSRRYDLRVTRQRDGIWTRPERLKLAGDYSVVDIALSPDGERLYFCSDMPSGREDARDYDIWYVEREEDRWSTPQNAGTQVNSDVGETQPTFTDDGAIYFPSRRDDPEGEDGDIFVARPVADGFAPPVKLPAFINTDHSEGNSFIAPDESYLLYAQWREDGGKGLYISFRDEAGDWSMPVDTKPALKHYGSLAALSPDRQYLFFSTRRGIFWVRAEVLERLRPRTHQEPGQP